MAEYEKYLERAYEALESAKILFENEKYNASISQAYYAMFYASKALLSLKRIYPRTHRGVVSELGLRFVNEGYIEELYGKILAKGLQLRERVDYDVYYRASKEEAEEMINEAEMFVERIRRAIEEILKRGEGND
ncbi:HEPN domain protein [Ferroglobus placidus DSM 10642]|uniref:HEPN domain protein n=1 Tax=Ferroglobus placidus (strain DSM 10642 / AEDII12DO) TaxID=589924 RepID=D3S0S8_FERPA|nr:HEPN domain-containing protein [Ferroglobus placidus]ADC66319.1 HEPN domain protein [Ferroglobus placidus DSM 10642]